MNFLGSWGRDECRWTNDTGITNRHVIINLCPVDSSGVQGAHNKRTTGRLGSVQWVEVIRSCVQHITPGTLVLIVYWSVISHDKVVKVDSSEFEFSLCLDIFQNFGKRSFKWVTSFYRRRTDISDLKGGTGSRPSFGIDPLRGTLRSPRDQRKRTHLMSPRRLCQLPLWRTVAHLLTLDRTLADWVKTTPE